MGEQLVHEGQESFRSQVAYVSLVAFLILSALIVVVLNSQLGAAICCGLGVVWTAVTLRSGIDLTEDGLKLRGRLRTRQLTWSDLESFTIVRFPTPGRAVLSPIPEAVLPGAETSGWEVSVDGFSGQGIAAQLLTPELPIFSAVAAVTRQGECLRVPGTAATPLDPAFPFQAVAELNRRLNQQLAAGHSA
jgi:hypothetical protein